VRLILVRHALPHRELGGTAAASEAGGVNGAGPGLTALGRRKEHLCAFARVLETEMVIIVVARLIGGLVHDRQLPLGPSVWEDTRLQLPTAGRFSNILTGQTLDGSQKELPISQTFSEFPVALLNQSRAGARKSD